MPIDAPYDFDVIVVGSGPGGCSAATEAANLGKKVALIEQKECLGGVWIHSGTIPNKLLRSAIVNIRAARRVLGAGPTALSPSGLPMSDIVRQVENVVAHEAQAISWRLARSGVTLFSGQGAFLDPHTMLVSSDFDTRRLTAAFFVLAPGSRPKRPASVPFDGQFVLDSEEILGLKQIPSSLTVVGAGIIGLEYANMFAALGVPTTVVDRNRVLLDFVDREVVEKLQESMQTMGTAFLLGETVASVTKDQAGCVVVHLASGNKVSSDVVLFCIGRQGNIEQLKLGTAGVGVNEQGLIVHDEFFRSRADNIYAVGDVIGFPALASTAMMQGQLAVHHLAGRQVVLKPRSIPYALFTIPEVAMVGYTEDQLVREKIPYEVGRARYCDTITGQILDDSHGMLKLIFRPDTKQILGVHSIGSSSAEMIPIGQAVMELGGTLDYFTEAVFNLPTLAESYRHAALNGLRKVTSQSKSQR